MSSRPGELAALARDTDADLLVVVGGDGALNEVVNGRRDIEIAVIPRGTGMDFVRTHGQMEDVYASMLHIQGLASRYLTDWSGPEFRLARLHGYRAPIRRRGLSAVHELGPRSGPGGR